MSFLTAIASWLLINYASYKLVAFEKAFIDWVLFLFFGLWQEAFSRGDGCRWTRVEAHWNLWVSVRVSLRIVVPCTVIMACCRATWLIKRWQDGLLGKLAWTHNLVTIVLNHKSYTFFFAIMGLHVSRQFNELPWKIIFTNFFCVLDQVH